MTEEESILDATVKKKKKKKKPNFDFDAATGEGTGGDGSDKKFNLDDLENALPDGTSGKSGAANDNLDDGIEEFNLDMDFSKTKKKKKKKKDIDELVADEEKDKNDEKDLGGGSFLDARRLSQEGRITGGVGLSWGRITEILL